MQTAIINGKALTAIQLLSLADINPQSDGSHLNKLVVGELLVVKKQGRHECFQLKDQ